jgi:hypothetical protein
MRASSPVLDTDSRCVFAWPIGCGASAVGLMTKSAGVWPGPVALYTMVCPSGMNRALVIGRRSKVLASKLAAAAGARAGTSSHVTIDPRAMPATAAAPISSGRIERRASGTTSAGATSAASAVLVGADSASRANAMSLAD